MPAYQLYEINSNYKITNLINTKFSKENIIRSSDPETTKIFVESHLDNYRNISFKPTNLANSLKILYKEFLQFSDQQSIWLSYEKSIIRHENLLLIEKANKKLERLIGLYLRDEGGAKSIIFDKKKLWSIWKNLRKQEEKFNIYLKLHRLILKNGFLGADKYSELNVHSNNLEEMGILNEMVKYSEKIKTLTIKIRGFKDDDKNKWVTFRIDTSGSVLLYGKHENEILVKFLQLLKSSI